MLSGPVLPDTFSHNTSDLSFYYLQVTYGLILAEPYSHLQPVTIARRGSHFMALEVANKFI